MVQILLSIRLDGSFGSCTKRVKLLSVGLKRLSPPSFHFTSPVRGNPVPIQRVLSRSSNKALTSSLLKLFGLFASCVNLVNFSVFGSRQFKPPPSVPTQMFPR